MPTATEVSTNTGVQSTTDYSIFSFIDNNRDVHRPHVENIKRSLEEDGNFLPAQPILVNGRLEVIDGQHRLTACEELGIPVYYSIREGLTVTDARRMNILHRRWTAQDYLKTWAGDNLPAYVKVQQLVETYDELNLSTILLYAVGRESGGLYKRFRQGEMQDFDLAEAQARLDQLTHFISLAPDMKTKSMARAFLRVINTEGYDSSRMEDKFSHLANEVRAYQSVTDNVRALEYIYNWHVTERGFLRFL